MARSSRLRASIPSRGLLLSAVAGVGFAGVWAGAMLPDRASSPPAHLREVRAAVEGERAAGPRLSVTPRHRACPDLGGIVPRSACAPLPRVAAPDRRVMALSARAAAAARGVPDADALHRAGLVDLLWSGAEGKRLDASISSLEHAVRLADAPAALRADLAAALLLRAERDQSPRDVLLALEETERALAEAPGLLAALFNRALALERIGLARAAREAWGAYAEADGRSGWGAEARERAAALVPPEPPRAPEGPDTAAAEAFAAAAPQEAMLWGLEVALGRWAEAVLADRGAEAEGWLRAAEAAGGRLERDGRDASLADAARAARESTGAGRAELARAHAAFAEAARLFGEGRPLDAEPLLAGPDPASPVLAGFVRLHRAMLLGYRHERVPALRAAAALAAETDSLRHPALAARARWVAGTMARREGRAEEALAWYRAARPLLERAGWEEGVAGLASMLLDTRLELGERGEAYLDLRGGLRIVGAREESVWLHNFLLMATNVAAEEGLTRTSLLLMEEAAELAARSERPHVEAEARLSRARLLSALADHEAAREEVARAEAALGRIASAEKLDWFAQELRVARAVAAPPSATGAVALLDSAIAALAGEPARLVAPLVARAEAHAAGSDFPRAAADLERASAIVHAEVANVEDAALRRGTAERARGVWDRLLMARLAAGASAAEALAEMERGRSAFSSPGPGGRATDPRLPRGEGALGYALVGDTLLVWAVRGDSVHLARRTVPRAELLRTVERVRTALELRADDDAVRPDLARLFEWLVRPVQGWLPPQGSPLRVVADGEIAAVPFAALLDGRRNRFLVEDHALRFAERMDGGRSGRRPAGRVLLVADPAFDAAAHPGLARLASAEAEVREIAGVWGTADVLAGENASRERVRGAIAGAALLHYAGHAVFDDARPERSYLLLAGTGERAHLTASEAERMDLRGVALVVLSACETVRAGEGRAGGFAGFTGALLRAGAGGVVGSTWRVEDEATRALMVGFHTRYRATLDAAGALREAQLEMLQSREPSRRTIAKWAAFRYAGHR